MGNLHSQSHIHRGKRMNLHSVTLIARTIGAAPSDGQMAALRRLFWESHSLALADIRQRSEHGSESVSKKLPASERKARAEEQKTRLTGVICGPDSEPSHQLVDRFVAMVEEGVVSYVRPELCTSRALEVANTKQTNAFHLAPDGNLKLKEKDVDLECPISGELRLREAYRRKALAMDLAALVSYRVAEEWHSYLFMALQREVPKGFRSISVAQLMAADKRLWILLSEQTRGEVHSRAGQDKPCDSALTKLSSSHDVLNFLIPIPDVSDRQPSSSRSSPYPDTKNKGKGKGGKQSSKSAPATEAPLPEGCSLQKADGKPVCGLFNRGKCWHKTKPGKRCPRGFHVCWKTSCNRQRPWFECTHTD